MLNPDYITLSILEILANTSIQAGLLILFIGFLLWAFRIKSMSVQYSFWLIVLFGTAVLPLVSAYVPLVSFPIQTSETIVVAKLDEQTKTMPAEIMPGKSGGKKTKESATPSFHPSVIAGLDSRRVNQALAKDFISERSLIVVRAITLLWLLGISFMLLRLGKGYIDMRKLLANSERIGSERFSQLRTKLKIKRKVELFIATDLYCPVSFELFSPKIFLPQSANLSEIELDMVLGHELAHIKQWDCLINLLQRIIEAIFFFHPLIIFASRRLTSLREHICDDYVIEMMKDRISYAKCLTRLFEYASFTSQPLFAKMAGQFPQIRRRVMMILDDTRKLATRMPAKTRFTVLLIGCLCVLLAGMARVILLPIPSLFAQTEQSGAQTFDPWDLINNLEIIEGKEEIIRPQENSPGQLENRSSLFKNRGELAQARVPDPDCYGVLIQLIYATARSKSSDYGYADPWGKANCPLSFELEEMQRRLPQAKVEILLNERINLRLRNGLGKNPNDHNPRIEFLRFIQSESPIQPICIKILHEKNDRYAEQYIAFSLHSEPSYSNRPYMANPLYMLYLESMREDLSDRRVMRSYSTSFSNRFNVWKIGGWWEQAIGKEYVISSGYLMRIRLIEQHQDNITLNPGEMLDLSKPPFMAITKLPPADIMELQASPTPKATTRDVSSVRAVISGSVGRPMRRACTTITGTVYHEDGLTPFAGASVYARPIVPPHYHHDERYDVSLVQTDAKGRYQIRGLPVVDKTITFLLPAEITAFADKMRSDSIKLTLNPEKIITQDFILKMENK